MNHPFPDRIHFSVAFPEVPTPLADVWQVLTEFLMREGCLPKRFEVQQFAGHPEQYQSRDYLRLTPDEMMSLIVERNMDGFWVTTGHTPKSVAFHLLNAKYQGLQSVLSCRIERGAKAPTHWGGLVEALMTLIPTIGGWQWRHLYQVWQWANEIHSGYILSFGEPPPGYVRRFERVYPTLTPQPDRVLIDVSKNPGRPKVLLPTINFYPTAEMWLGPHFWQYAKCTKEEALAADFFIEKRDSPHYLYLKCWPEPFTRPDGEQGRMQQRLWNLFFHEDCEWPPGSGAICDEPMYGPHELMPQSKAVSPSQA